ncbi:MAG: flagellar basal body rod C-terminal domain-containing protein [Bilophila sp.]
MHAGVPGTNNVDTGREMTSLVSDQRAFEANAAVITTRSDMDDTLLGIMVDQKA